MTRWKAGIAVVFGLAVLGSLAARGAERDFAGGPQWPNVELDAPQWPSLQADDLEAPRVNPRPSFLDPQEVEDRIMGRKPRAAAKASAAPDRDIVTNGVRANPVDTRWPKVPPERLISPFVFEAGARYWYSSGSMNFGFTNGNPLFGNPTSTLDWRGLTAHTGEGFVRVDHIHPACS